jgi:ComF family protein
MLRRPLRFPVSDRLRKMAAVGLDLIFPLRCCNCNRLFGHLPESSADARQPDPVAVFGEVTATVLCPACRNLFKAVRSPMCTCCGRPFETEHSRDHVCGRCQRKTPRFHRARSAGQYETAFRAMIHAYKYQGRVQLAGPLGLLLWRTFRRYWEPEEVDCVLPVPLHPRRLRQRGFNQALLLVNAWPRLAAREAIAFDKKKIGIDLIRRNRHTDPQTGLDRDQRAVNVRHAFVLTDAEVVRKRRFLIVDDVLTTGATVDACARLLLAAGADAVHVLTLARAD